MSSIEKATDQFSSTENQQSTHSPQGPTSASSSFDEKQSTPEGAEVSTNSSHSEATNHGPTPITPSPLKVTQTETPEPETTPATQAPASTSPAQAETHTPKEDAPLLQKAEETVKNTEPTYAPEPNLEEGLKPRISVIGVGGAGCNAITNMIKSELAGVEFYVANTDAQALEQSEAGNKIQLGLEATHGLGAGSHPEMGRASAEESIRDVLSRVGGSHMLFVTAGMGGGTGTGAAPVIAKAAREHGILTVGVVTKPFHFEGAKRMRVADAGIEELQKYVDTLIVIPNQNLFRVANEKTTFVDAFKMADEVLYSGVRSVTDLMMKPGLINLDFADVKAVMGEMMGKAMMGTGEAEGEGRAIDAAEAAISSPLLDDVSMKGAKAVLINITGGMDMTLFEADEAANRIREEVDPNAHIIFGSTFDESLEGKIRVSCVATGIDAHAVVAASVSSSAPRQERRDSPEATAQVDQPTETSPRHTFGQVEDTPSTPHVSSIQDELGVSPSIDETLSAAPSESTYDIYSSLRKDMNDSSDEESDTPAVEIKIQEPSEDSTENDINPITQARESIEQRERDLNTDQQIQPMFQKESEATKTPTDETEKSFDDSEPRGFFSRLMGRKKTPTKTSSAPEKKLSPPPAKPAPGLQPRQTTSSPAEQDDLDVPAFLRRKDRH